MKDIHEVLRRKQAKYAQLGKQIEMLQQVADKLREVAPLLAENDDDDASILDADEPTVAPPKASAAAASPSAPAPSQQAPAKPVTKSFSPRWP
ncbi:MAG TPA: hypothetical protein VFA85_00615 [Terriglobales bacterium]|nr:hypothetical protein [Terriglobales bacterium]